MIETSRSVKGALLGIAALLFVPVALIPEQNEQALAQFHNRTLTRWPQRQQFVANPVEYFGQTKQWLLDRIGFVQEATAAYKNILYHVLATSPAKRVILGGDGHVYLGGINDTAPYGLLHATCDHSHTQEVVTKIEKALLAIKSFAHSRNWSAHALIVPMTPTLYADFLPRSVPASLRASCLAVLHERTALLALSANPQSDLFYALKEMKAHRDDEAFFPIKNYHPSGLSLKLVRDAYIDRFRARAVHGEEVARVLGRSEILSRYGINTRYPVYRVRKPELREAQADAQRLAGQIQELFHGPPLIRVFNNTDSRAAGRALMVSDSLGIAFSEAFAPGYERLVWIFSNGLHRQQDFGSLLDRVAQYERFDSVILLLNEGAASRLTEWGDNLPPNRN